MQTGYFTVCNPEPDSSSPEDDPRGIFSRYLGVHRVRGLRAAKERFHQNNPTQTLSNMPFTLTHLEIRVIYPFRLRTEHGVVSGD
ncbi:hypothetical protein GX48_00843 [Paracoccidioides brasiliensis]|nr:hypothetical protein GX48_00843 [Paracoccidioides brasiliensis]